uniref:thioredoxin family protein n=1 Tax=Nosocomiicoccus ampullae TaxID=489910 RepID=UPI000836597C|nr:thioredoxin family protein [Nosocomiicoccus ampullae]
MNNKLFYGIIAVVIIAFAAVFLVLQSDKNNPEKISESGYYPYTDKEVKDLQGPTIDRLDDENYHFNETPEVTQEKIDSEDELFVYYWSPVCKYCIESTPLLIGAKEKEDFPLVQLNVLEYPEYQQTAGITATPTLVYYKNGKEVTRAEGGAQSADNYVEWIKSVRNQ